MTHTIVMAEWTRNCEPNHESREKFLWHQMLLSLMYDEVMAQDQTIVNSKRIANWFHKDSTFPLLRELFECNGVGILKRPIERYPQELKEIALSRPVFARATHISKFSANNDGTPVTFSQSQLSFHAKT